MCLRVCDLEISESSNFQISGSAVVCTSYGQLVEFKCGKLCTCVQLPFQDSCCIQYVRQHLHRSLVVVQSLRKSCCVVNVKNSQVIFVLESVESVFVDDFVGNGLAQLLFLPAKSSSDADVVSMMDEVKGNGVEERFLLTDFEGIHIHHWTSANWSEGEQMDGCSDGGHRGAIDALSSRLVVGRALVNEMNRLCSRKLRLIRETCEAMKQMTLGQSLVPSPQSILISLVGNQKCENLSQDSKSESPRAKEIATGDVWQRIFNRKLMIGLSVHNQTNRSIDLIKLCLSFSNSNSIRHDVTVYCRCVIVVPNDLCKSSLPTKRPKTEEHGAWNHFTTATALKDVHSIRPNEKAYVTGLTDMPVFSLDPVLMFNVILTWREEGVEDGVESSEPGKMQLSRMVGQVTLNVEEVVGHTDDIPFANGSVSSHPLRAELDDLLTFHSMQISQCIRLSSAFGGVANVLDSLQKDFGFRFLEALGCFVCLEPKSQLFCSRIEVLAALNRGLSFNLYAMNLSQYSNLLHLMLKDLPPSVGVANSNQEGVARLAESLLLRLQQELLSVRRGRRRRETRRKTQMDSASDDAGKHTDVRLVKRCFESRKEKYLKDEISETKAGGWKFYEAKLQTDRQLLLLTKLLSSDQ